MDEMISIIVPVYNVEKYLDKCLLSLIEQTYTNIEIVLVDDGSQDNCPYICDCYAKRDNRIHVIHKSNGGLSDARNVGVNYSNGKYLLFVDSDDFVTSDYVEYLYVLLKKYNADISICEFACVDEEFKILNKPLNDGREFEFSAKDALKEMLRTELFSNSASGKLIRKELTKDILFPVGRLFEDVATTYKYFLNADVISFGAKANYFYYYRNGSLSRNKFKKNRLDAILFAEQMKKDVIKVYPDLKTNAEERVFQAEVNLFRELNRKEHLDLYIEFGNSIKRKSKCMIWNKNVRKRNKILAIIASININLLYYVLRRKSS